MKYNYLYDLCEILQTATQFGWSLKINITQRAKNTSTVHTYFYDQSNKFQLPQNIINSSLLIYELQVKSHYDKQFNQIHIQLKENTFQM